MRLRDALAGALREERWEPVGIDVAKLLRPVWPHLSLRFAFGAAIALVAGLVGIRGGPRIGGLFLAFPAVLPAALTLLEREEGTTKTDVDALGAILGALAMVAFAVLVAFRMPVLLAALGWVLVGGGLFNGLRVGLRRLA